MSKIFFTSDTHYYHNNVIRYCDRPYTSVEEMNEDMVKKWNEIVSPDDVVYHLGDFSLAIRPVELFTPRLNGVKYLVPGNHDWIHPTHKKGRRNMEKWVQKYMECGWYILPNVGMQLTLNYEIGAVNLCHMPYGDRRFPLHTSEDNGNILLCGHVHEKWKTRRSDRGTLMINVGVDVWGMRPVRLDEIVNLINLGGENDYDKARKENSSTTVEA